MMQAVQQAQEDADVAVLLVDINENLEEANTLFESLKVKAPAIVVINKLDTANATKKEGAIQFFSGKPYCKEVVGISALQGTQVDALLNAIVKYLPEGEPFFAEDEMTDLPTRFFVAEMIREKIFYLFKDEIPYHTTVIVREFKEKTTLVKIVADIVVQRESQKGILLGEGGKMIRQLGTDARKDIEQFIGQKVFLELFVKVKPKWRDNDFMLKEYGYH
jgi:GTP-binding protein Era